MLAAGDEPGDVGRVEEEEGADLVGDGAERRRVDDPRVGRGAGHDHLGAVLEGEVAHLVEVDALVAGGHAVGHEPVEATRGVDRRPVGEVSALIQAEAEHGVADLEGGEVGGHVGVGAGMGLHVGVLGAEERSGPLTGEVLDAVDHLVAAVVALAGVALGVLVGEHRAGGAEHGRRREVLAGDQLDGRVLPFDLLVDQAEQHVVVGGGPGHQRLLLDGGDLVEAALVTSAFVRGGEPEPEDLVGQGRGDDPATDREHVGVVVLAAHAGEVQVVAEGGAHAPHLVGGDLLALAAASEDDAPVDVALGDEPADLRRRSAGSRRSRSSGCRSRRRRGRRLPRWR